VCRVKKELILDFKDLRHIDIACHQCGMHMVLDASDERIRVPAFCAGCHADFDSVSVVGSIRKYVDAYRVICELRQVVTVRVPIDDAPPAPAKP
jgi:hypothetical protein